MKPNRASVRLGWLLLVVFPIAGSHVTAGEGKLRRIRPQSKVVIHKLMHEDPRATNIKEMNYDITKEERNDFARPYAFALPPSSAFVLVNEQR